MKLSVTSLGKEPASQFLDHVRLAEILGFDGFFHNDAKWRREVYARLGAAAAVTSRIGLGVSVTDPYTRHPAVTAQATATLAEMAPGRFTAILGAGSHFESLPGYSVRKPLVAIREATDLMRKLWAGEQVTIDGEIVKFHAGQLEFHPDTVPKIWIAARGEKMLSLGGEVADGVLVGSFATPAGIEYAKGHVLNGLEQSNRTWEDITLASWLYLTVLELEDDVIPESIRGGIAYAFWSSRKVLTAKLDELAPDASDEFREFLRAAPQEWRPDLMAELQRLIPRGLLDSLAIIGTKEQVIAKLQALEGAGVQQAIFWLFPRKDQDAKQMMAELAGSVLPALRP